jgi:hypothetical protein
MALTPAQQATLKADIQADAAFNSLPQNSDGAFAIAEAYKLLASPDWTVWKSNVTINEVGKKFNGSELAGLTTGNQTRLQTLAQYLAGGVNPSLLDNRQFFDDVFSGAGGAVTRANLLILWKRLANRAEKLFSTGTGSNSAPATMTFEGTLSYQDVLQAMGW